MKRAVHKSGSKPERIGVLGGTFNPIHLGHLHIAERARKLFELSQVLFVVSTTPPHKSAENLVDFTHRCTMVGLATAGAPALVPALVELSPPASPFSIDTLVKVSRARGVATRIYFIAGGDSILEIASWHRSVQLLADYDFIFVARPGVPLTNPGSALPPSTKARLSDLRGLGPRQLKSRIRIETARAAKGIFLVDLDAPDISASNIRERVRSGQSVRHLTPPPVCEYMQKLNLYGDS